MAISLAALPDARRTRSYLLRLPLATRGILFILLGFYTAQLFYPSLQQRFSLIPDEINLATRTTIAPTTQDPTPRLLLSAVSRLNTYPLLHLSLPHLLLNILALTPLLERFESDHGTLTTFALFTGPFGLLPGGLYTLFSRYILRSNTPAAGSSIFVLLLLSNESLKTSRTNPHLQIKDVKIPTWTTPLILILVISFLVPHTSLLGHLCGAAVGYLWGLGWIRFLAPHDKILRWVEGKLNLLGRLPHYVSVDQKVYGRYGVLPTTNGNVRVPTTLAPANGVPLGPIGTTQRLGP